MGDVRQSLITIQRWLVVGRGSSAFILNCELLTRLLSFPGEGVILHGISPEESLFGWGHPSSSTRGVAAHPAFILLACLKFEIFDIGDVLLNEVLLLLAWWPWARFLVDHSWRKRILEILYWCVLIHTVSRIYHFGGRQLLLLKTGRCVPTAAIFGTLALLLFADVVDVWLDEMEHVSGRAVGLMPISFSIFSFLVDWLLNAIEIAILPFGRLHDCNDAVVFDFIWSWLFIKFLWCSGLFLHNLLHFEVVWIGQARHFWTLARRCSVLERYLTKIYRFLFNQFDVDHLVAPGILEAHQWLWPTIVSDFWLLKKRRSARFNFGGLGRRQTITHRRICAEVNNAWHRLWESFYLRLRSEPGAEYAERRLTPLFYRLLQFVNVEASLRRIRLL